MTESFLTAPDSSKAQRDSRKMRGAAFPLQPSPLHGINLHACADSIPSAMKARTQPAAASTKTGKTTSQDVADRAGAPRHAGSRSFPPRVRRAGGLGKT